jgi:hypothetical protein
MLRSHAKFTGCKYTPGTTLSASHALFTPWYLTTIQLLQCLQHYRLKRAEQKDEETWWRQPSREVAELNSHPGCSTPETVA